MRAACCSSDVIEETDFGCTCDAVPLPVRPPRLLPMETEECSKLLDSEKYKAALLEFLRLIDGLNQPKALIAEYLRYPASEYSTLGGSPVGRDIWEKPPAQTLISTLFDDDELRTWFNPPPGSSLTEPRAQIASLVAAWDLRQVPAAKIVEEWSETLLQAIKNPAPACSKIRLMYGVEVSNRIELSGGIMIEPVSTERLREFLARSGGFERDVLRVPRRAAVFVSTSSQAERRHFGPFAATTANAGADILAEFARWDIWLATGLLPTLGDTYVIEHSQFPVTPDERYPASPRETHAHALDRTPVIVDGNLLQQVHERMDALRGEHEQYPEETMMPLWVANTYIHPAIDADDDLVTILLAYSCVEGLLLRRGESKSRLQPRLALLVQHDTQEGRRLRRTTHLWKELRDCAAHGERPAEDLLAAFCGQETRQTGLSAFLAGDPRLWHAVRKTAATILRRVFLAMLFCTVTLDDQGLPQPSLSRNEVLEILERAASGDNTATQEIISNVPQFVRDIA